MPGDPSEIGRLAAFAQVGPTSDSVERQKERLTADFSPSTAASTSRWVGYPDIFGRGGQTFDVTRIPLNKLEQMRRDPMIAFGLMFIKVFLARAPWYIKSTDARRAALIDGALRKIYARFILQYCGCLDFGHQAIVKNFERAAADWNYADPNDPNGKELPVWSGFAQPLLWKPFTAISPRRCSPSFDRNGDFAGFWMRQSAVGTWPFTGVGAPDVPLDWALWCTNEKDSVFGNLYGYPRTGYAYRYWWAYWYRFALADRAFEKWADPPVVAYHPVEIATDAQGKTRDLASEGLALAEKLRSGANVSLPSTPAAGLDDRQTNLREWSLEQITSTVDFTAFNQAFEYLDIAKLRALMVPEQAFLEGKGGTSSRNVASTLGDVFEEQQAVIKAEIDDHLNRYVIPQLVEANFGPGGPTCEIISTGFDNKDIQTMREVVQAFAQNDPTRLASIDFRVLLERLGIPLLNPTAQKEALKEILQTLEAKKPAPRQAEQGPPGQGTAGVTPAGLYYNDEGETIQLYERVADDTESGGRVKRIIEFFGRGQEPEAEAAVAATEVKP